MSDYTSKEIEDFARDANRDLGGNKYKPQDLKIDYCKAINIIKQLQDQIKKTPKQIRIPDTEIITEYTRFVMACASAGNKTKSEQIEQGCIGISTEAGELLDNLKKWKFQERMFDTTNAIEECGDLLFYMSELLEAVDSNIFEAIQANVRKLKERYKGERFDKDRSLNRDTVTEREVLESTDHSGCVHADEGCEGVFSNMKGVCPDKEREVMEEVATPDEVCDSCEYTDCNRSMRDNPYSCGEYLPDLEHTPKPVKQECGECKNNINCERSKTDAPCSDYHPKEPVKEVESCLICKSLKNNCNGLKNLSESCKNFEVID